MSAPSSPKVPEESSEVYMKKAMYNLIKMHRAMAREAQEEALASEAPTPQKAPKATKPSKPAKAKAAEPVSAEPSAAAAPAAAVDVAINADWNECECSKFRNGSRCPREAGVAGYFMPHKGLTIIKLSSNPEGPGKKVQLSKACAEEYAKSRPKRAKNPNGKKAAAAASGDAAAPAAKKKKTAPAPAPAREEEEEEEVEQYADEGDEEGQVAMEAEDGISV